MKTLLVVAFLAACGGSPRPPTPAAPPPAPPANPTQHDVTVWTSYDDFSGHGFKGAGRFYRSTDGAWQSAPCEQSQVADPQAGPQPGPTCGAWQPVDRAQWPTLEKLRGSTDVICSKQADTCRELGL